MAQSLGSLLTPFYKNALVKRQVETGRNYAVLVEKEVWAEAKRAWSYYVYAMHTLALYREQLELADRLQHAGELRYEQGEITLLEKSMTSTLAADMRTRLFQAQEELRVAARRLQWACYSDSPIEPAQPELSMLAVDSLPAVGGEAYRNYFSSLTDEKIAMLKVERSRFFPELSFGYVRQDIRPLRGLNSWMVGASFPLYFVPQRSKIRQARIAADISRIETDRSIRELDHKVGELRIQLNKYGESIRYYRMSALKEAEELMKAADLMFRESETDITEYIQSLNAAREIKRGYIEAVYQYNVAALEYELYR